ncbi:hypothetical protein [Sinorhizobium fredii]|uniref:hypothetical protein n=1 Tax=Rhizobium fredii TaxID=380 RepID=UPI0013E8C38B|nr:hypothetical protein [Sinorhizobium fredii]
MLAIVYVERRGVLGRALLVAHLVVTLWAGQPAAGEAYAHCYLGQFQLLPQVLAVGEQRADCRFRVTAVASKG